MNNVDVARFGLYLHWPFCQSKCPYCDFNSHVAAKVDHRRWQAAYLSEIERAGRETSGKILESVFFGGGTPSLMPPDLVAAILEKVRATWRLTNSVEITMEANPGSVEAGRFAAYRAAGVDRVSIGVQALDDDALRQLGRLHSTKEAIRAVEIAQATFSRVNFDLIYARQGQSLADWKAELSRALSLQPTHMSLYQLTIEEGTVFHERHARGLLRGLPDEDLGADLYNLTQGVCEDAGLPAYEVSNHAKPGEESRHNLIYWHGGDYVGVGPGAHGRLTLDGTRYATECTRAPNAWLESVETDARHDIVKTALSPEDISVEYLMMGLRLKQGISMGRLARIGGKIIDPTVLKSLTSEGLLDVAGDMISPTRSGVLVLNSILRCLLAG